MNKNRNSKVEIRGKSEIRNPKSDAAQCAAGPPNSDASQSEIGLPARGASDSLGGSYRAHEADNHALVLKEETSGARAARGFYFGQGVQTQDWHMPQGIERNDAIPSVNCDRGTHPRRRSKNTLSRSQTVKSDFWFHLEEEMTDTLLTPCSASFPKRFPSDFGFRISFEFRVSDFGFRAVASRA